jgi:hypothetical protein
MATRSPVRIGFSIALATGTALVACSFVTDFASLTSDLGKDAGTDGHHAPPDAAADAAPVLYLPAPGEYHYTPLDGGGDLIILGTGGASLPVPYSPLFFVQLVPKSAGCWDFVMPLSKSHTHTYSFCNVDGGLAILSETDLFTAGATTFSTYSCGAGAIYIAPNLQPDADIAQTGCSGGVDASTALCNGGTAFGLSVSLAPGTYVLDGVESLVIADAQVPTLHFSQHRTLFVAGVAGSQDQHDEWWFTEAGLPIQHIGHTSILESPPNCGAEGGAPLVVTFQQNNSWVAADLSSTPLVDP